MGVHEFRQHFGWYMQRAHAGERFLVTRRGKPHVRLIPARDQPPLPATATSGTNHTPTLAQ